MLVVGGLITEIGGVAWILAANWVPYQPPTFVTPTFLGYFSGHSTFSRAGAKVLTSFTGSGKAAWLIAQRYYSGGIQ